MNVPLMGFNPNQFTVQSGDYSGLINGLGMLARDRRQQQMIEQQKAEQQEQMKEQQARLAQAADVFKSGDPNAMADFMIQNPDLREGLIKSQNFVSEATKQKRVDSLTKIAMGAPVGTVVAETAQFIKDQGGDPSHTLAFGQLPQDQAQKAALAELSIMMEPQQFRNFAQAIGAAKEPTIANDNRTAGMKDFDYYQELKKSDPEAAKSFGIERGFINREGLELSAHMQKRLSDATDSAITSENNASNFEVLASDIEAAKIGGGLLGGTWKEKFKEVSGTQDAVSDLRRKYAAIRASQVVNNLPPGAASDKDIELAIGGFPSDKASGQQLAGFLRGLSKLEKIKADYENFKADYISENGSERGMLAEWKRANSASEPKKSEQTKATSYPEGTVIRNPNTGQTMIMSNGQWVAQ